jgi:nucleoside-diphosphate-sugar epimerase
MGRRALITGATGFVGGHLARRLTEAGWELGALVRPTSDTRALEELGVTLWRGDLGDRDVLRRASGEVEVVFHLAAVTAARDDEGYRRANVEGTRTLVEAFAEADPQPRRLVYLSSYAACGPAHPDRPRRMDEPPAPLTAYGRTKLAGEEVVRSLDERGAEVVVVRAPAVYGPGDRALLPYFRLIRWGVAPVPNGGESRLHLIYVGDLARALEGAADAGQGVYAAASPGVHRWSDVVGTIASVMDRRPFRISLPAPLVRTAAGITQAAGSLAGRAVPFNREKAEEMLASAWICDLSGSEAILPPEQATPLREGISRTVRWYTRRGWL